MQRTGERSMAASVARSNGATFWRWCATLALVLATVSLWPWTTVAPSARAQELIALPPPAPGLAAPADNAIVQDDWGDIALQWTPAPRAVDYQVVLNGGERTGPWTTGTTWSPGSLPDGEYVWSVLARNDAGVSVPGQSFRFSLQTIAMAPGAPAEAETAGDASVGPLPFQLQQPAEPNGVIALEPGETAGAEPAAAIASDVVPATEMAGQTGTPAAAGTPVSGDVTFVEEAVLTEPPAPVDGTAPVDESAAAESPAPAPAPDDQANADDDAKRGDAREDDQERKDREEREAREARKREREARGQDNASNGNGGVSEVVADPVYANPLSYAMPEALRDLPLARYQQDATDAISGSVGESGTINGEPRETTDTAPVETTGPGAPLAPGNVQLPPSVAGPNLDPAAAAAIGSTTELAFDAVSDTTVFTTSPGSPQSEESAASLAIGGPQGAVSLISFEVSGVGEGTVLAARLTFYGSGASGAPGGSVGVIYDFVARDGLTANGVPDGGSALNVHGAPAWFERVEPNGLTAVDVSGSVSGDGVVTFVLPGQPEETGTIYALESGTPPQLLLTVALPA